MPIQRYWQTNPCENLPRSTLCEFYNWKTGRHLSGWLFAFTIAVVVVVRSEQRKLWIYVGRSESQEYRGRAISSIGWHQRAIVLCIDGCCIVALVDDGSIKGTLHRDIQRRQSHAEDQGGRCAAVRWRCRGRIEMGGVTWCYSMQVGK